MRVYTSGNSVYVALQYDNFFFGASNQIRGNSALTSLGTWKFDVPALSTTEKFYLAFTFNSGIAHCYFAPFGADPEVH